MDILEGQYGMTLVSDVMADMLTQSGIKLTDLKPVGPLTKVYVSICYLKLPFVGFILAYFEGQGETQVRDQWLLK